MIRSVHIGLAIALVSPVCAVHGDLQFSPPIPRTIPAQHLPTHIGLADLDGDGNLDVVIPGRNPKGSVFLAMGLGDGQFGDFQEFVVEGQTDWVEIHDFDSDGTLDLVLGIRSVHGRLALLRGNGDGTFSETTEYTRLAREPRCVVAADFDTDGDIDLCGINYLSGTIDVLLNDGTANFIPFQSIRLSPEYSGLAYPQQAEAADLDGDGHLDLAVAMIGGSRINILRNRGDASFESPRGWPAPIVREQRPGLTNLALGDFDLDGDVDVATSLLLAFNTQQQLMIWLNDGDAGFQKQEVFPASLEGLSWVPASDDLDGDGDPDVAIGYALPGPIVLMENMLESPGATPQFSEPIPLAGGQFIRWIDFADLDGDCDLDMLAVEITSDRLLVYLNLGDHGGCGVAAASPPVRPSSTPVVVRDEQAWSLSPGDWNHDGLIDALDAALGLSAFSSSMRGASTKEGRRR